MPMPSGILCNIIAIDKVIPSFKSILLNINVAIPSGMLCKIIPIIDIIPVLYNLSPSFFVYLLKIWHRKKPI